MKTCRNDPMVAREAAQKISECKRKNNWIKEKDVEQLCSKLEREITCIMDVARADCGPGPYNVYVVELIRLAWVNAMKTTMKRFSCPFVIPPSGIAKALEGKEISV